MNPIRQDIKNGKLRFVKNCFPHHGYIWNYGAFPQTWENPDNFDKRTEARGDNDPLDVCEIGSTVKKMGDVITVKILGTLALIDEGEMDWKIIAININDELAPKLNDISDVETFMPGLLNATHNWFTVYKIPDGKPKNQFAFNGQFKDKVFASEIIKETHEQWEQLIFQNNDRSGLSCMNTSVVGSPHKVSADFVTSNLNSVNISHEAKLSENINKWFFVDKTDKKLN